MCKPLFLTLQPFLKSQVAAVELSWDRTSFAVDSMVSCVCLLASFSLAGYRFLKDRANIVITCSTCSQRASTEFYILLTLQKLVE